MDGGDLLDAKAYTLNGMMEPLQVHKPTRNQRREDRFQMSTAPCPLPIYHSELDRNLVNHFQKPSVRQTLQSKSFQRMLPGIDHELKMEMNPPVGYLSKFTRGMYNNKQGSNATFAQPVDQNGVRNRVFKDAYHVAEVDGRLQQKPLALEKVREEVRQKSPRQNTRAVTVKPPRQANDQQLSMVGNTAFGIRNETHGSPFMRRLPGGLAGRPKPEEPPSRPDSVRSEDWIAEWKTQAKGVQGNKTQPISHGQYLDVSRKYPPHMQHHHHYGWSDPHISTSLYKPKNNEPMNAKFKTYDADHAISYINNVRTTHTSISRCPTTTAPPKKLKGHNVH